MFALQPQINSAPTPQLFLRGVSVTPPSSLRTSLVGYYNLDETTGTDDAIDSQGGIGSLFVWGAPAPSVVGPGLNLGRDVTSTGFKGFVDFEAFDNAPFSINFWINQTANGGQYPFDATGSAPQGFTCFLAVDGGFVEMYAFPNGVYESPGPQAGVVDMSGLWTMLTLVWDGVDFHYYQDGIEFATGAFALSSGFDIGVAPFQISADFLPVIGSMALFGVWVRALTPAEVLLLYNGGNGLNFSQL